MLPAIEEIVKNKNVQFAIIGSGDSVYENALKELQNKFPEKIQFRPFSVPGEKLLTAYSDFFLNASWYEPCGLNQMFAMLNGTIPIVSNVGGLKSSVVEGETGFFIDIKVNKDDKTDHELTKLEIIKKISKIIQIFETSPEIINKIRINGMKAQNSWQNRIVLFRKMFSFVRQNGPEALRSGGAILDDARDPSPSILLNKLRDKKTKMRRSILGPGCKQVFSIAS